MSWMCVGCSKHHVDNLEIMGFGMCRVCADKAKTVRAKIREDKLRARGIKIKKRA